MATGGCGGANDALAKEKYPERFLFSTHFLYILTNFPVYTNKYRMIIVIYFDLVLPFYKNNETPPLNWFMCREDQKYVFVQWQTKFEKQIQKKEGNICLDSVNQRSASRVRTYNLLGE